MNYQVQMNNFFYGLQCQLWDLPNLIPTQFYERSLYLRNSGYQPQLMQALMESARCHNQEKGLIKYIHIVDKLLKVPEFGRFMQSMIVDLYTLIFISFWNQKCFNEIQELKILRKFWVGIVNIPALQQMKHIIFRTLYIDIEYGFKPEIVTSIRNYYDKKLSLSFQQISRLLPFSQPQPRPKIVEKVQEIRKSPTTQAEEEFEAMPKYGPKRPLQISNIEIQDKPRKLVHKDHRQNQQPKKKKHVQLLEKLNGFHKFKCGKCGKAFLLQETYDKHLHSHYLQNRKQLQIKTLRYRGQLRPYNLSQQQWVAIQEPITQFHNFIIPLEQSSSQPKQSLCPFCGNKLHLSFTHDQWVYQNAIKIQQKGILKVAHKSCHYQIEQSNHQNQLNLCQK